MAFLSIRVKLVFWFLVIALAPLAVLLFASHRVADESVERAAIASMAAIAEAKGAQLEAYARERVRSVSSISTGLAFVGAAQELSATYAADGTRDAAAYDAALARFKSRIDDFAKVCEFPRLLIIDQSGRVVYSTVETPLLHRSLGDAALANTGLARALEGVRRDRRTLVSPPMVTDEGVRPSLEVVGPLVKDGAIVGFAAVTLAPAEIDAIVTDYTGLGKTGDIVGLCSLGREIAITTPMRNDRDAAYSVRRTKGSDFSRQCQEILMGNPYRGRGRDVDGDEVFGAWVRVQSLGWGLVVSQHVDEAFALAHAQQSTITQVALITVVPVVLIGFFVARSLSRPIATAATAARRLADGDLSMAVKVTGSGEPRALLESTRDAVASLVGLLGRLRSAGQALGATASRIQASARDQGVIARQFGEASVQISAAVREITTAQRELNDSVQSVAGNVRSASGAASGGRDALERLSREIDTLAAGAASISARLEAIRGSAEKIDGVVASVTKVANQTNLLSVNAAMEAERAGEAGAGFRAVAAEIRRLSAQTAEATLSIEAIVKEVRGAVTAGVEDMERYSTSVRAGVSSASSLGAELGSVIVVVEKLASELDLVARGMEAQALGVTQVSESIDALSDGAARTASTAAGFGAASAELEARAGELAQEVSKFKLPS